MDQDSNSAESGGSSAARRTRLHHREGEPAATREGDTGSQQLLLRQAGRTLCSPFACVFYSRYNSRHVYSRSASQTVSAALFAPH